MSRSPSRILLALAPLLALTSACDKGDPEPVATATIADSEGESEGDSEGDSEASPTSEGSESETGDSETDPDTTSTTEPPVAECEFEFLLSGKNPAEVLRAYTAAQESWDQPEPLEWCEGEHSAPCTTPTARPAPRSAWSSGAR